MPPIEEKNITKNGNFYNEQNSWNMLQAICAIYYKIVVY
jgi:hypothetical protein